MPITVLESFTQRTFNINSNAIAFARLDERHPRVRSQDTNLFEMLEYGYGEKEKEKRKEITTFSFMGATDWPYRCGMPWWFGYVWWNDERWTHELNAVQIENL